jgi:hypothetical protein
VSLERAPSSVWQNASMVGISPYQAFVFVWVVVVGLLILGPLRRVVADRSVFRRMLLTLLPALAILGAGFALVPASENLGFFLFGLGLVVYGFNWLANRAVWARAFTAWFGRLSPLYRAESSSQVVVVVGGSIALVVGVGIMVAAARG